MFKLLVMGALIYLLYRMVMRPYLNAPKWEDKNISEPDNGEYVEYEEVE